jgi:putative hydrolase of the HAD superfamily
MLRQPARALLIDFDGVLRRWDPSVALAVEKSNGLEPGTLEKTAFAWEVLQHAISGAMTDAEWMQVTASRLPLPEPAASDAVAEWQLHRGTVDPDVLSFVREVRAAGRPVALATNATDRLPGDLELLGLTGEFDAILNSSDLKIHKPAPEFFAKAVEALGVAPGWTLMLDDDDRTIRGARAAKLLAFRWTGPQDLPYLRKALDLPTV